MVKDLQQINLIVHKVLFLIPQEIFIQQMQEIAAYRSGHQEQLKEKLLLKIYFLILLFLTHPIYHLYMNMVDHIILLQMLPKIFIYRKMLRFLLVLVILVLLSFHILNQILTMMDQEMLVIVTMMEMELMIQKIFVH